jgi:hypothetical protein
MRKPPLSSRRRGGVAAYILLETVLAGGIVSIALGTTITIIASSRYETSQSTRRAEASALALGIADGLMGAGATANQGLAPVVNHPGFRAGFTISADGAVQVASVPALSANDSVEQIVVTVEYPTTNGKDTLVYQRLRRKVAP